MSGLEVDSEAVCEEPININTFIPLTKADIERARAFLKGRKDLKPPPRPLEPVISVLTPLPQKLAIIQKFIDSFEYNHDEELHFDAAYGRPLCAVMHTATSIIREALPIRCVEGVFLSLYMTRNITELTRIPLSFESYCGGRQWGHIVLAVRDCHTSKWGALGMSRRAGLKGAKCEHPVLSDIVKEFIEEYERCFHRVKKVRVGLPVSHEMSSAEIVVWKHTTFDVSEENWAERMNIHMRALVTTPASVLQATLSPSKRSMSASPATSRGRARSNSPFVSSPTTPTTPSRSRRLPSPLKTSRSVASNGSSSNGESSSGTEQKPGDVGLLLTPKKEKSSDSLEVLPPLAPPSPVRTSVRSSRSMNRSTGAPLTKRGMSLPRAVVTKS